MRTLVVFCPDWPVTALGASAGEAVAVTVHERVVAASDGARSTGVRQGQRRREAEAYCPHLVVRRRDPAAEVRAFEPVLEALEAFGVPVASSEPGWAALGTRGPARRLGGEAALARAVGAALAAALEGAGHRWRRIGVADGPFAATLAAVHGGLVVPPGDTAAFLAGIDVAALDLAVFDLAAFGPATVAARPSAAAARGAGGDLADLLRRLGIPTLGAFAALDPDDVLARFGPAGLAAHDRAAGREERRLTGRAVPADLAVERRLDPPETRVDAAAFVAKEVAERLGGLLAARGLACRVLRVELGTAEGGRLERLWADDGAWRPGLVAERLRWQLEAWLARGLGGPPGAGSDRGIELVRLVPVEVVPDQGRQLGLFGRPPGDDERAARAVIRVQGLLGAEGVLRPVRTGGRGPKEQVRLVPFGDPVPAEGPRPQGHRRPAADAPAPWPGRLPAPSPAIVPVEPEPVGVLDALGAPVTVDGRGRASSAPARLVRPGARPATVIAWAGPWPVDERWWDRAAHRRRARLQVLTDDGTAYLLVLEAGRWALEGAYD